MTCIVGIEHGDGIVTLGADSATTGGWTQVQRATPKVFIAHGIGYASAGSVRVHNIIEHDFIPPPYVDGLSVEAYLVCHVVESLRQRLMTLGALRKQEEVHGIADNSAYLIACRGELYEMCSDFQIRRDASGHAAGGSGEQLALGSLHTTGAPRHYSPATRALLALEAAAAHNSAVCGPFTILEVPA